MTQRDYYLAYKFIKLMKKGIAPTYVYPFTALIGTTTEQYERILTFLRTVHQIKMI